MSNLFSSTYTLLAKSKRFFIISHSWKQGEEHWLQREFPKILSLKASLYLVAFSVNIEVWTISAFYYDGYCSVSEKNISVLLWKLLCCFSTPCKRINKNLRGLFRISIGLVSWERCSHTEIVIKNKIWHQYDSLLYEDQPRSDLKKDHLLMQSEHY